MWRTIVLMIGFGPWLYASMVLNFMVMYTEPVIIPMLIITAWSMLYGMISYLWLAGRTRAAVFQALLVPIPLALYMFVSEWNQTGLLQRGLAWVYDIPVHAAGVVLALWILHLRRKRQAATQPDAE